MPILVGSCYPERSKRQHDFPVRMLFKGRKTYKIAEAISQELGRGAVDLKSLSRHVSGFDLLTVGSNNYGGR